MIRNLLPGCHVSFVYLTTCVAHNVPRVSSSCCLQNEAKRDQKSVQSENALLALRASRHARGLSATSAVIQKHGGVHSTAPGC